MTDKQYDKNANFVFDVIFGFGLMWQERSDQTSLSQSQKRHKAYFRY
jgi:hypothetical protein